jgi:hypothetical protein
MILQETKKVQRLDLEKVVQLVESPAVQGMGKQSLRAAWFGLLG